MSASLVPILTEIRDGVAVLQQEIDELREQLVNLRAQQRRQGERATDEAAKSRVIGHEVRELGERVRILEQGRS